MNSVPPLVKIQPEQVVNIQPALTHYCFLPRDASLHDALSCFEDFATKGKSLDAVLVTQSGKPDQKPLGILTVHDPPKVLQALGLRRHTAA